MEQMNQFRNVKSQQVFLLSRICHSNTKQIIGEKKTELKGKKSFWLYVLRDLLFCIKSIKASMCWFTSICQHWGSQWYRKFWRGEPQKLSLVVARAFMSQISQAGPPGHEHYDSKQFHQNFAGDLVLMLTTSRAN